MTDLKVFMFVPALAVSLLIIVATTEMACANYHDDSDFWHTVL